MSVYGGISFTMALEDFRVFDCLRTWLCMNAEYFPLYGDVMLESDLPFDDIIPRGFSPTVKFWMLSQRN